MSKTLGLTDMLQNPSTLVHAAGLKIATVPGV